MDWTKQADEMIKTWTSTQQKMFESWVTSMQAVSNPQAPDAWEKTVETWRGAVKKALESQVELTRLWSESMAAGMGTVSMPKEMTAWTSQMVEMTKNWTETQARFSESWFDMLKKTDPMTLAQSWNTDQAKKVMQTWQEAAQKAVDAQLEWSRTLMTPAHEKKAGS